MSTIKCNKCQCENTTDAKFCRGCNGKICTVCHKTNDHDATFCVYCGNEFTQTPVPPRPTPNPYTPPKENNEDSNMWLWGIIIGLGLIGFVAFLFYLKAEFPAVASFIGGCYAFYVMFIKKKD